MKRMNYTIRPVPTSVITGLRKRAKAERKSLNQLLLTILEQGAEHYPEPILHHDLDFMIGSWVEDSAFDEAMKQFAKIDEELWK
jgi:hypothetical protein